MTDIIPVVVDSQNVTKPEPPIRINASGDSYSWEQKLIESERPDQSLPILRCKVEVFPGIFVHGAACGRNLFIASDESGVAIASWPHQRHTEEVDPFFTIESVGNAYTKTVQVAEPYDYGYGYYGRSNHQNTITKTDSYEDVWNRDQRKFIGGFPWNYLNVLVTFMGQSVMATLKFKQPPSGEIDLSVYGPDDRRVKIVSNFFGLRCENDYDVTINSSHWAPRLLLNFIDRYHNCTFKQSKEEFLLHFLRHNARNDQRGIGGIEKRKEIRKMIARLEQEEPTLFAFWQFLKDGQTRKGMSNNRCLKAVLLDCGHNYRSFKNQLTSILTEMLENTPEGTKLGLLWKDRNTAAPETRVVCMLFKAACKELDQLRAKTEWNFRVGVKAQAEGLGIDAKNHRELMKAVVQKKISLELFHKTGDPLALINTEFDVWEKALRRKGWADVIFEICSATTNKNRFEKHVTPYLSFLFRIEKYLKRHTGRNWKAMPKVVNSEAQLEMQEKDENGTVKTRSALTPLPDNEQNTITVPYAGLRIYGAQTTYCYSKLYQVFEEDTIDLVSQTVIPHDLVKKLNGRDDYGLMYYTLDGSFEAQGYPAFLVIFERRSEETFVHFHRVHPCRRKDGRDVPAHKLIEECYRYMAGNIRAEEITAQQGDLIFIKAEPPANFDSNGGKAVLEFESHRFETQEGCPAVRLFENEAKSIKNRLGFVYSPANFLLAHPEHENVGFPAGYYEVRRCKSWEANPTAVWSYTFD